ncbi:MAG TPA: MFS transporter [Polyangiaceae bacterium]|nr:MFS transporter [Polyangiaceae bacterium]
MSDRPLPAPFWAIVTLPFGLAAGFAGIAVPFGLRARGLSMTTIGTVSFVSQLPHIFKLLWSPALDSGPRRRSWFLASVVATAAALAGAVFLAPDLGAHVGPLPALWAYTAVLFASQAGAATCGSAVIALIAVTVPSERRGRAAGWQTAGNLVGTSAGGALVVWMFSHLSPAMTAATTAGICLVCAGPALWTNEVPPPKRPALLLVLELVREIGRTLRSRAGWTGLLICLSPVGAGALTNLFGALARDYAPDADSSERLVIVVTGTLGGLVNAAGSLAGGYLADRYPRRLAYVVFGGMTAVCAGAMAAGPATAGAFTAGCLAYQFTNGLAYAAFYAFVFDLVGSQEGVTTQLSLFAGASNLAITYVTWLDGWAYDRLKEALPGQAWAGRGGMLGMDALATFLGIGALWGVMAYARRTAPQASGP